MVSWGLTKALERSLQLVMARYESMNALVFLRICGNENVGPRNYHVSKENSTKLFGSDRRVYSAQEYIYLLHWNVQNRSLQLTCQSSRLSWIWSESAKPGQLWWRLPVSSFSIVVGPLKNRYGWAQPLCMLCNWKSFNVHWAKIVETLFSKPC